MTVVYEQWAEIPGTEGRYAVSNLGRVRNAQTGTTLKAGRLNSGYAKVDLYFGGAKCTKTVHRLAAAAFVPNPSGKPEVNHKDSVRLNNGAHNLEWATRVENLDHARRADNWDRAHWRTSTTGVRGVTPHADGGFIARTTVNKERIYLGYFKTLEEATTAIAPYRKKKAHQ